MKDPKQVLLELIAEIANSDSSVVVKDCETALREVGIILPPEIEARDDWAGLITILRKMDVKLPDGRPLPNYDDDLIEGEE